MPGLLPNVDPDGLLEYSVVFTDRAVNHMSLKFRNVVKDISRILKQTYNAHAAVLVPGSGTFGMESVARQFGTGQKCLVIRNGWFSYRWSQIFEVGKIPSQEIVLKARRSGAGPQAPFAPAPIEEVTAAISKERPAVVFAPHVETASGMILPPDYMRAVGEAVHAVGGLFALDCIASGAIWVDMKDVGADVLISAPQKGWSGPASCAMVLLSASARERLDKTQNTSFTMDLKKWMQIMEAFEAGGHAYHTTMPTDALTRLRDAMLETEAAGLDLLKSRQQSQGDQVRALLESKGFGSVAAKGFQSPGVVVSYTTDPDIQNSKKFAAHGLQAAAGVPLQCDEGADFKTFRLGLFGLDKLKNVERTVQNLAKALDQIKS
ncbi:MAG TPA: aminotransferase class V-fold PLP-dependent enzyme [Terriglobia bacterium]